MQEGAAVAAAAVLSLCMYSSCSPEGWYSMGNIVRFAIDVGSFISVA